MQYKLSVSELDITKEDLVELFSTMYDCSFFRCWIPPQFNKLSEGTTYEEQLADVLLAGKYIKICDFEESVIISDEEFDKNYDDNKQRHCNSLVLPVHGFRKFSSDWSDEEFYCPVYKITLDRIKTAFEEIITGNMTGKYSTCVRRSFDDFIAEYADAVDYEILVQYIVFGDAIYG